MSCASNRYLAQKRVGSLYRLIANDGICVYCGVRATTVDHFVPLSVVNVLVDLELHIKGSFCVPACSECNCIAGSKLFRTVAAKRRYIQGRLRQRYARELAMPDWSSAEKCELDRSLRTVVDVGEAKREWVKARLGWRNTANKSAVDISAIRFKYRHASASSAMGAAR